MILALHNVKGVVHIDSLICNRTSRLWSGAFQTRTVTSSFAWFKRNNRYDSANTGRSQRALSISTQ